MAPAERKEPDLATYKGRFGDRIKTLRDRRKMSVVQCVEAFNEESDKPIQRTTWHSWERGETAPALDYLPFVALALQVKLRTMMPED